MILLLFATQTLLTKSSNCLELNTGQGNIYSKVQHVETDLIQVDQNVNVYFQYFESLDQKGEVKHTNKLLFYFGNSIQGSAQQTAYMGYYPYTLRSSAPTDKDIPTSELNDIHVNYNNNTLNTLGGVVGADVVRGTGFNTATTPSTLNYNIIRNDTVKFVNRFLEQVYFQSKPYNSGTTWQKDTWKKELQIFLIGGYDMAKALIKITTNTSKEDFFDNQYDPQYDEQLVPKKTFKLNNDVDFVIDINYSIILENAYLGYSSLEYLNYALSGFGIANGNFTDFMESYNFKFLSTDYSLGLDWVDQYNLELAQHLKKTGINIANPIQNQTVPNDINNMTTKFFTDCQSCRAYVTAVKNDWEHTPEAFQNIKQDYYLDYKKAFDQSVNTWKYKTFFMYGINTLKTSFQGVQDRYNCKKCFVEEQTGESTKMSYYTYNQVNYFKFEDAGYYIGGDDPENFQKKYTAIIHLQDNQSSQDARKQKAVTE